MGDTLISQALAIVEAHGRPVMGGEGPPLSFEQVLVHGIYQAARGAAKGWNSQSAVDEAVRLALRGGIAQLEVDAALAAARVEPS